MESKTKEFVFGDFNDPNKCDWCRDPITESDRVAGLVLHVKRPPTKSLDETGKVVGLIKQDGPPERWFHARPCAELYAKGKLVCDKCNYWIHATKGGGLCLCVCHPPRKAGYCSFLDNDLERAGGK